MRTILFALAINLGAAVSVFAGEVPTFTIRQTATIFWNEGLPNEFFYLGENLWSEIISRGNLYDPRSLRQFTGPDPELWFNKPITENLVVSLSLKYESLRFTAVDTPRVPSMTWDRRLDARLSLFSVGSRLQFVSIPFHPYVGGDLGLCRGSLLSTEVYHIAAGPVSTTLADGSGGGMFFRLLLGAHFKIRSHFNIFGEFSYTKSPRWKDFSVDQVSGNFLPENSWLINNDRQLELKGMRLTFGAEIGIL